VTVTAWRIVKARHVAGAFDGEGARIAGGRWNSPGVPVVYAAGSAALATLEMLVHLGRGDVLPAYVLIAGSFDAKLVRRVDADALPRHWRSYPAPPDLQRLGDEWLHEGSSPVLEVPSAIIPSEANYLLNPRHRQFAKIRRSRPQPFELDLRLLVS
jgi:RES domain-containing protein